MGLMVPCGQCMNCRLQKREEWCLRILHEHLMWDSCIFLTLTYSDDHLPENESLVKSDLQKFFKRLRKRLGKRKIAYFASGEYGEENGRPHYHCIIFGLDFLNENDRDIIKESWELCDWKMLGRKPFGDVTIQSIRYTVSYMEKEILGKQREVAYDKVIPPFHILSKGIGKRYAITNRDTIQENGCVTVQGYKHSIPRYYSDVAEIERDALQDRAREKEIEMMTDLTGHSLTRDEGYIALSPDEVFNYEEEIKRSNIQHDLNLHARASLKARRKI